MRNSAMLILPQCYVDLNTDMSIHDILGLKGFHWSANLTRGLIRDVCQATWLCIMVLREKFTQEENNPTS